MTKAKISEIRIIQIGDLNRVLTIYKEAIDDMIKNDIFQWDEIYPDEGTITGDINNSTMYGHYNEGELSGVVVLNQFQDEEYNAVKWKGKSESALIVHRLCIDPEYKNKGIATMLMKFTEDYAKRNGFKTIRLDAFKFNPAANAVYCKLHYKNRGSAMFRKGEFICYEKEL